jgi:hypothetical protein
VTGASPAVDVKGCAGTNVTTRSGAVVKPDWDKELAKIDRRLESVADEAIFPSSAAKTAGERAAVAKVHRETSTFGVFVRLVLSVALGVGMLFWPYEVRCGFGLAGYLAATGVVIVSGAWSALWTWRHRAGSAHVLSLLLIVWGGLLAAQEILPRVGYAKPDLRHPATWSCG